MSKPQKSISEKHKRTRTCLAICLTFFHLNRATLHPVSSEPPELLNRAKALTKPIGLCRNQMDDVPRRVVSKETKRERGKKVLGPYTLEEDVKGKTFLPRKLTMKRLEKEKKTWRSKQTKDFSLIAEGLPTLIASMKARGHRQRAFEKGPIDSACTRIALRQRNRQ